MFRTEFWTSFGEAAKMAGGFFGKSGWAFVLGYFISALIQAFMPKGRRYSWPKRPLNPHCPFR